ncbi:MAG: dTDP-glucose 4,6-dehydratase, partial [Nitrospiraceae bacterium]
AGFIGSHLCDRIIVENPSELVVIDNLFLGRESNLDTARAGCDRFAFYKDSVADHVRLREILVKHQPDVVFNLSVIPLPKSLEVPGWSSDENWKMTLNLCESWREGIFKTLVHFSSSEVYGTARAVPMTESHPLMPHTPYAASKAATDHLVFSYMTTFNLDAVTIRPFNNYGPRQNKGGYAGLIPIVIDRVLKNEEIEIHGDGKQTRDFIFVKDTADATVRAYQSAETRGKMFNLCSGEETSVNTIVNKLLEITGSKVQIRNVEKRPGDVYRHCGDAGLAHEIFGFSPQYDLVRGLINTVQWYRN